MSESLSDRARRGVLWLVLVNLASKGSQMVLMLTLASLLTPTDLGLIAVVTSLVNTAQTVQALGVYEIISRTERDEHVMAGTVLTMFLGASAVLTIAGLAGSQMIADVFGVPAAAPLIAVVAVGLPFTAVGGVQMALMHRGLDFRRRLLPDAGSAVLGASTTILLAALGRGPMSMAIGLLVTAVLQPVFSLAVGVRVRPTWDRGAAGEAFRWIRMVGPGAIIDSVLLNVDFPIVSRILGANALGLYSLAFRIAWVPFILVAYVVSGVAFPVYSRLMRERRRTELPAASARFTQAVVVAVGGLYVVIALMADRIVLLGESWAPAAPALIVLCAYGMGLSLLTIWYQSLKVTGRLGMYLGFEFARLAVLVTALLLLTRHGITSAAFAQMLSVWCLVPVLWLALVRVQAAPTLRNLARATLGFLVPALSCTALVLAARWNDIEPSPGSLIGFIIELAALILCYIAFASLMNRSLFASFGKRRTKNAGE